MLNIIASVAVPVVFAMVIIPLYLRFTLVIASHRAGYMSLPTASTISEANVVSSSTTATQSRPNHSASLQDSETTPLLPRTSLNESASDLSSQETIWTVGVYLSRTVAVLCLLVAAVECVLLWFLLCTNQTDPWNLLAVSGTAANILVWIFVASAILRFSFGLNLVSWNSEWRMPLLAPYLALLVLASSAVHAFHALTDFPATSTALRWRILHISSVASSMLLFIIEVFRSVKISAKCEDARIQRLIAQTDVNGNPIPVPCTEESASIFSIIYFSWVSPLIRLSSRMFLEHKDIWALNPIDCSSSIIDRYSRIRTRFKSLGFKLMLLTWQRFAMTTLFCLIGAILALAPPFFINRIVDFIEHPNDSPLYMGFVFAFGLFGCSMLRSWCDNQYFNNGRRTGMHLRSVLISEIYKKSLRRCIATTHNKGEDDQSNDKNGKDPKSAGKDTKASSEDSESSLGKIVTLMSVDTCRIREIIAYIPWVFTTPLQIIACVVALFGVLGYSAIAGVAVMVITMPIVSVVSKFQYKVGDMYMAKMDARVGVVNEMLQCIRVIKYFGWESEFFNKVNKARQGELNSLIWCFISNSLSNISWESIPVLVSFVTFMTYTLIAGQQLTATTAFTSLSLFMTLRFPLMLFPNLLMDVIQGMVSLRRIETFLAQPELDKYSSTNDHLFEQNWETVKTQPGFDHASFTWNIQGQSTEPNLDAVDQTDTPRESVTNRSSTTQHHHFVLSDIHVKFPVGQLTAIVGLTGAGKSSIINALLGEMKTLQGRTIFPSVYSRSAPDINSRDVGVAYVSQTAWLQNATVRDNILFGSLYDADRYAKVIEACALVRDLETFPAGDQTEIGEKGINMSGGQKQRISLARACYSTAQSVILDDPLSAVDAPTALHLFEKCIRGLLASRTVILVTHATGLVLPFSDYIVYFKDGRISAQGLPAAVQAHFETTDCSDSFGNHLLHAIKGDKIESDVTSKVENNAANESNEGAKTKGKLVEDETKQSGSVKLAIYKHYIGAVGGWWFLVAYLLISTSARAVQGLDDLWLKVWADSYKHTDINSTALFMPDVFLMQSVSHPPVVPLATPVRDPSFYIWVYGGLGLGVVFFEQLLLTIQYAGSYNASKKLHSSMLNRVLNAPMRFFDTTPIGRILNRFSKDIECIDMEVSNGVSGFLGSALRVFTVLMIVTMVAPLLLLLFIPIVIMFYNISKSYLLASRELRRLESVSQSPIYAKFSETLQGAATIRAFGVEEQFINDNMNLVDKNHQAHFYLWACNRWLSARCDLVSGSIVFITTISLVLARDTLDAGIAGLCLAYATELVFDLDWVTRSHAMMEMSMNSVERIDEYLQIEQDAAAIVDDYRPAENWPHHGCIDVKDLSIRYSADQPLVLDKISFHVGTFEKIGIVGRTGAGKSTLSLAMFRIVPHDSGHVLIDGMDIGKMGLWDLRSRLTIIPQDPVLFSGTVRTNLDPFDKHDDAALWAALKRVHFLESMQTRPGHDDANGPRGSIESKSESSATLNSNISHSTDKIDDATEPLCGPSSNEASAVSKGFDLESPVQENGTNFSQGQRQLLCLARALLQASRIIIMDEATASVDHSTDARIQNTIRTEFSNATVLTIAHRLSTVMDYDKILVLDRGQVSQYGRPHELLEDKSGLLYQMCMESGEMDLLVDIAAKKASLNSQ
ncbi:hypothetical protein BDV3_007007 [Batrachochytrium dendrobatidis]